MTAYRNDVEALAHRHAALTDELTAKTREVAAATQLLDEAKAKARLPVLDNIRVATPCPADWNAMTGDERVRACASCNKNVFNISNMTRDEAQALMIEKNGSLCVRYFQRKDGTILLKDCSIGIAQKRKRKVIAAGAFLLLGGAALFAFRTKAKWTAAEILGPTPTTIVPEPEIGEHVAGGIEAAPPPIATEVPYEVMGAAPPVRVPVQTPVNHTKSPKHAKATSKKELTK